RYLEVREPRAAKRCRDGDVGCVEPGGNQYTSNPRRVVSGVECPPSAAQKHFEPRAEIHWTWNWRDSDVSEVSSDVTRGHVQSPAERDREVLKIAADAHALGVNL